MKGEGITKKVFKIWDIWLKQGFSGVIRIGCFEDTCMDSYWHNNIQVPLFTCKYTLSNSLPHFKNEIGFTFIALIPTFRFLLDISCRCLKTGIFSLEKICPELFLNQISYHLMNVTVEQYVVLIKAHAI